MTSIHKTVLLNEAIDGLLAPHKVGNEKLVIVDATFGGGGHSSEICRRYPSVKILALDQDKSTLERVESKFKELNCDFTFINDNFRNVDKVLEKEGIEKVDGIIFDLGLSSDQLSPLAGGSGRGFSFLIDEPLLMTMKENPSSEDITAQDVVNTWEEESLADIIYGYGEEKQARRIAKEIVEFRKKQEIKTTFDLVKIIEQAIPAKFRKGNKRRIHFATKTFQAIRIAVNDELGALAEGLEKGFQFLKNGGRMSVISFHSLEDRIVKRFYKEKVAKGEGELINKKVILAGESEIKNNPRSRSAKLRILEKK
ncbi:16S rRNA (cytosine(1402)-N(4))-methyltransferase [Candidatus Nomurabacteria bacterium RIFCSPHIGHO2_01_FULL_42_15]|uniref:Ribosomal RNA small subunit methyltransferase H n=1 Tax=Candidatus Nomurabacteria bacterium RIFCSPHIGHO2_01_FULL_42_15 TaxID=1801742 RepID=A0A1F6VFM0_9BACT|nr:MAG: 16S rRNA (cytosine(1402)-N(4))-methyltransferase [Candidatus Nomurabacteria bacterium RIFCSPHIGHO2_01_FULL_42_15]OGI93132.1 MAG: 16S rRNA (cytosine(1402)-N(4))-methyltransferase [Candidatus Nomurabacteria bacterium RIFCSPLOWO2_01_FULL_41_18]